MSAPNPDDFPKIEYPDTYVVTFTVTSEVQKEIKATSKEMAVKKAHELTEDRNERETFPDIDNITEVDVDYIHPKQTMYRVTREGQNMQVSALRAGDLPREPDAEGGF